jgi:hypothetical protein
MTPMTPTEQTRVSLSDLESVESSKVLVVTLAVPRPLPLRFEDSPASSVVFHFMRHAQVSSYFQRATYPRSKLITLRPNTMLR